MDRTVLSSLESADKESTRGEQTASAMERNLLSLEKKIDDLLASVEANEKEAEIAKNGKSDGKGSKAKET